MAGKRAREHPDDVGVDLAPPVTAQQRTELYEVHYRGPWPSTAPQADALLRQWRGSASPEEEAPDAPAL
jgi:hypothetical protein